MFVVREVKTLNFMGHAQRKLELPERGLRLITGNNGVGKSTFIEAVAVAFWGETLRGTPPWRQNIPGAVEVVTDALHVRRGVDKAGKQTVMWNEAGKPLARNAKGDTLTKAQAALERHLPLMNVWAWSCVLSKHDTSRFTMSPDSVRRSLLESMMGLLSTDEPLKLLRSELAETRRQLTFAEGKQAVARAKLEAERRRLAEAEAFVSVPVDLEVLKAKGLAAKAKLEEATAVVAAVEAEVAAEAAASERTVGRSEALQDQLAVLQARLATANAEAAQAEAQYKLCSRGVCSQCGQTIAPEEAEKAMARLEAARAEKAAALAAVTAERVRVEQERSAAAAERARVAAATNAGRVKVREAIERMAEAKLDLEACRREYASAVAEQERQMKLEQIKENAATNLACLEMEGQQLAEAVATLKFQIARDEVVEVLLGAKGVRARLLAHTLNSITDVANGWLAKVAGPRFRLKLKPYSDKGQRGAISLEIIGAGGGYGYKASSDGERKRIDLALMLALGDIARQTHDAKASTLFFDEAFDGLDVPGREAAVRVLEELAQDRCVVVVSHDERLIKALERHGQRVHLD